MDSSCMLLGHTLPHLAGESQFGQVTINDYLTDFWGIIVTFPSSHHPVWLSELGILQKLSAQFEARQCRIMGLHIATLSQQRQFLQHVADTQKVQLKFPIIADPDAHLFHRLGLCQENAAECAADVYSLQFSATILVDLDLNVQHISYYPISTGRNFYETLRMLDALQLARFHRVVTPCNWKMNDDVFVDPLLTNEDAKAFFPQGYHEIQPYLRLTSSTALDQNDV
uniref:Peroxidase putative n=1 Tax=Albugo laibachii Nc14 TaxID=890382 RepID=F0WR42_9STRA|nr:Peroxidase putative [Albugo laibachii Nc14]|eukprot:CCA23802.1 Peroxidase putative [Albugo laibachii Nc14]